MRNRSRDEEFRTFFAHEGPRLERFATLLAGDPFKGADLAQEALARVYARWGRIKDGAPSAYARRIVVNEVRSQYRTKKLRSLRPVPEWAAVDEGYMDRSYDRLGDSMHVARALKELSPIRRAVVLLRFFEDRTDAEIARLLDRPLGTVKSDIHRALRQLRPLLEDAGTGGRAR